MRSGEPRCCVCGNAYRTRFMCAPCKADPANADWREADEVELGGAMPPADRAPVQLEGDAPTVRVWNPTDRQRAILRLWLHGGTAQGIAQLTGSSPQYVRRVLKEFKLQEKPEADLQ